MTLILRPIGRGNWRPLTVAVDGAWLPPPMYFAVGQRIELGGCLFRISRILP